MRDAAWLDKWKALIDGQSASPGILELGCGSGRDTRWLAGQGYADITAADLSRDALLECRKAVSSAQFACLDLREGLPFSGGRFDVVIASLCLHYFTWDVTVRIVREIRRCLADNGVLVCRVNSTEDVHYGAAGYREIARHYYDVEGKAKRFFDEDDMVRLFGGDWECLSRREITIDRYEKPKTVWEAAMRKR